MSLARETRALVIRDDDGRKREYADVGPLFPRSSLSLFLPPSCLAITRPILSGGRGDGDDGVLANLAEGAAPEGGERTDGNVTRFDEPRSSERAKRYNVQKGLNKGATRCHFRSGSGIRWRANDMS